jgi:hypothetical protein
MRKGNQTSETFFDIFSKYFDKRMHPNVHLIEAWGEISSYDLSKVCTAASCYASTLNLEFAIFGLPVIQVGRDKATGKKLLFEPKTVKEYHDLLSKAKMSRLVMDADMVRRARNYAHYWVYQKHLIEDVTELNELTFKRFKIHPNKLADPLDDNIVNKFADMVMQQKPFLNF